MNIFGENVVPLFYVQFVAFVGVPNFVSNSLVIGVTVSVKSVFDRRADRQAES